MDLNAHLVTHCDSTPQIVESTAESTRHTSASRAAPVLGQHNHPQATTFAPDQVRKRLVSTGLLLKRRRPFLLDSKAGDGGEAYNQHRFDNLQDAACENKVEDKLQDAGGIRLNVELSIRSWR
jgi:hypothetical protein